MERFLAGIFVLFSSSAFAAPVLLVDGSGQVTGATGLFVQSGSFRGTFDVSFQDGSCIGLYNGCDSNAEDIFPIVPPHGAANAALLSLLGLFSDSPELIRGCESTSDCYITSPINIHLVGNPSISGGTLWLQSGGPGNDFPLTESFAANTNQDFSTIADRTYAVWSPSLVPVPATAWLFGSALVFLFGFNRKR